MRVGQDALPALARVRPADALRRRPAAGRGAGVSGSGRGAAGEVVERAAVLVLEARQLGRKALERLAHQRRSPPIQVATSSAPAGPKARRCRRTTSSGLVALRRAAGHGAARRALGALVPQAPSAGARTRLGPALERRHLYRRSCSSSGRVERVGMRCDPLLVAAAVSSPVRGVLAVLVTGVQARQHLGARLGVRPAQVMAARPRPPRRRRPGARAPRPRAASRAGGCR